MTNDKLRILRKRIEVILEGFMDNLLERQPGMYKATDQLCQLFEEEWEKRMKAYKKYLKIEKIIDEEFKEIKNKKFDGYCIYSPQFITKGRRG